jgi:L-lactate dehydrogenase complex protein LldF
MEIQTEQFTAAVKRELQNARSRAFLKLMPPVLNMKRDIGLSTFPNIDAAQAYGAAIRQEAMARLPELLEEFEKNALANGAKVFWARDAKEANETILQLAKERGVKYVTKGKSMVTEEMGLNEILSKNGVEPWETDLGEFIAQQLHRPQFHIVGPAINVAVEEVCDLFMAKANMKEPTLDPVQLGYAARDRKSVV